MLQLLWLKATRCCGTEQSARTPRPLNLLRVSAQSQLNRPTPPSQNPNCQNREPTAVASAQDASISPERDGAQLFDGLPAVSRPDKVNPVCFCLGQARDVPIGRRLRGKQPIAHVPNGTSACWVGWRLRWGLLIDMPT